MAEPNINNNGIDNDNVILLGRPQFVDTLVVVGDTTFQMESVMLRYHSLYFDAAFRSSEMRGSRQEKFVLDDMGPQQFLALWKKCLYPWDLSWMKEFQSGGKDSKTSVPFDPKTCMRWLPWVHPMIDFLRMEEAEKYCDKTMLRRVLEDSRNKDDETEDDDGSYQDDDGGRRYIRERRLP